MAKLICGCGYLGLRVAQRWLIAGETVWATTRSPKRAAELKQRGIRPIVTDITRNFSLPDEARDLNTVLFAIGFDRSPGQTIETVYLQSLDHVLAAIIQPPRKFIYVSSTGVYEQSSGGWVNEETPCQPQRAGGRACLDAEQRLALSRHGSQRIVLRLAGLYGPGRLPKLAAVQAGEAIASPESGFLNLIHVDDAADVIVEVDHRVAPPATIVVSDGHPVLRGEFYRELARLVHAPAPRFVSPPVDSSSAERAASDKRVDNRRLREILGHPLAFPTYREGLRAIVG